MPLPADELPSVRPVIDRDDALDRLREIFPRSAFDAVLSNPLAGAAVAAMIYVGAVVKDEAEEPEPELVWARPSTVVRMSDEAFRLSSLQHRIKWALAEAGHRSEASIVALLQEHGYRHEPWYASNTRETLRDETWPGWRRYGAVRQRPGIPTTSSRPRWALTAGFADLFNPQLTGSDFASAVEAWRADHMDPGDVLRIRRAFDREKADFQVQVQLPGGGGVRMLEPGNASLILKGVVEEWAPNRLKDAFVVAISEPGAKAWAQEAAVLADAGITINVSKVLPDAIIVDVGKKPAEFWIVEAVATDGEVNEDRKADLLTWAADQYIDPDHCRFLSAFLSRHHKAARKRLKDLAVGTFAWFLDEPARELAWYDI